MNCEEIGPLIIAMVHEDLPATEEPAVREHLASCAACRAEAADFRSIREILREAGRREAAEEARLWERSEATKARVLALFEPEVARPHPSPASPRPEPAAAPVPHYPRPDLALKRVLRLAVAVAAAALVAVVAVRISLSPRRPPAPDRAQLLAGPVTVEVEAGDRQSIEVDGSSIEAHGPAAFAARLWESRESFEGGADVKTKDWVVGSGLVLAGFPILQVSVLSGSVSVENEWGRVTASPGEVAFAPLHWLPLVKEGDLPPPPAATLKGLVTGPGEGGPSFADLFELSFRFRGDGAKPLRRAFLEGYGEFSLPVPTEGTYLVLPTSVNSPVLPARGMVVAVGGDENLGDLVLFARSEIESAPILDSIRVDRGATVSVALEMRPAGTVRGVVRDRTGAPCPGASVEVRPARGKEGRGRKFVQTDASGRFEAPGILDSFEVEVSASDRRIGRAEGKVDAGRIEPVDIVVGKAGPLRGTVVDEDGRPVAGAKVTVQTDRQWKAVGHWAHQGNNRSRDATTGPDGAFLINEGLRLRAEPYTLYATAGPLRAGLVEGIDPFTIPPEGIRIVLRPTLELSGRVLDSGGRPVRASITLQKAGERSLSAPRVESGADGTFRFVNLPEGEFDLLASAAVHAHAAVRARAGDQGVEIRLAPSGWILRGRVLTPAGDPFPREIGSKEAPSWRRIRTDNALKVVLLPQDPRAAEGPIPSEAEIARTHVDLEDPRIQIEVPPGSPRLWLALMACARMVDVREVSGQEEVLFEYDLAAAAPQVGGLRILALDGARGIPIPEFEVAVCADGKGPWWGSAGLPGDVVGPLLPGRYSALVWAEGYEPASLGEVTVEAGSAGETIEVRL
ncbi:MAG: carboxypeptidase regulatory-like domain-containing protein, partial [Planctomycetes bacterium]|nr:carboxypeptidase regulatory-like domain-containing protein [Planctomycetota bacterium]